MKNHRQASVGLILLLCVGCPRAHAIVGDAAAPEAVATGGAGSRATGGASGESGMGGTFLGIGGQGGSVGVGGGGNSAVGGLVGTAGQGQGGSNTTGPGGQAGSGSSTSCPIPCSSTAYCDAGTCKSRITEFSISSSSHPYKIVSGADGDLWFTDSATIVGGNIGRITTTGTVTEFKVLVASGEASGTTAWTTGIALGPDGNVWFTMTASSGRAYLGAITPSGTVMNYLFSETSPSAFCAASGPDGNIWFTEYFSNPSGGSDAFYISTTAGAIAKRMLPNNGQDMFGITAGPDGNMWSVVTFSGTMSVPEIDRISTTGTVTEFPLPGHTAINITAGWDGNLWFTEEINKIGRITIDGSVTEFTFSTNVVGTRDLSKGPDDDVWFTESGAANIGRISPDGKITEFTVPSEAGGITTGPDGNIWFLEPDVGKIGRLLPP
jgi:streptogramin lyase